MQSTDLGVVLVAEFVLAALFFIAVAKDVRSFRPRNDAKVMRGEKSMNSSNVKYGIATDAEVMRGEKSMNSLYVMYGIITVVYSLLVQVADAFEGHKALLIAVDYVELTYLFFFSSWFRNGIFFRMLERVRHD